MVALCLAKLLRRDGRSRNLFAGWDVFHVYKYHQISNSLRVELSEYVNSLFGCAGKTICFEPACAGALATRLRAQDKDRAEQGQKMSLLSIRAKNEFEIVQSSETHMYRNIFIVQTRMLLPL